MHRPHCRLRSSSEAQWKSVLPFNRSKGAQMGIFNDYFEWADRAATASSTQAVEKSVAFAIIGAAAVAVALAGYFVGGAGGAIVGAAVGFVGGALIAQFVQGLTGLFLFLIVPLVAMVGGAALVIGAIVALWGVRL